MPIAATTFADPIAEFLDILPGLGRVRLDIGTVQEGVEAANIDISDIKNIDLPNRVTTTELSNATDDLASSINSVDSKADLIESARLQNEFDNAVRFDTWDADLQREVSKIDDAVADIADIKPKVGKALLDVADIAGKIFDIFGLIATLGTAIRMEAIYAELKDVDASLNNAIYNLYELLEQVRNMNEAQFNELLGALSPLQSINTNTNDIKNKVTVIDSNTNGLSSQLITLNDSISAQSSTINLTKTDTTNLINASNEIEAKIDSLPDLIGEKLCETLRNPLCNPAHTDNNNPINCPDVDISQAILRLDNILDRIGLFPYSCGDNYSYPSISVALQALTCGGFDTVTDSLKEYIESQDISGKFDEIKNDIANIEVFASIPESWQIRIEGDRPQLIVSYAEKYVDGFGKTNYARNRLNQSIPHYNGLQIWSLLPIWTRGNYQGKLILKDNSKLIVYANSENSAKAAISALSKFISPSMLASDSEFYTKIKSAYGISDKKAYPKYARFFPSGQKTKKENVTRYEINR